MNQGIRCRQEPDGNYLLYDNECPFCSAYVRLFRLREAGMVLQLLDARLHPELVRKFAKQGLNINQGMILKLEGDLYFGGEVMHVLALMSSSSTLFNRINRLVFLRPVVARWLYPIFRTGRNAVLRLLGRTKIST